MTSNKTMLEVSKPSSCCQRLPRNPDEGSIGVTHTCSRCYPRLAEVETSYFSSMVATESCTFHYLVSIISILLLLASYYVCLLASYYVCLLASYYVCLLASYYVCLLASYYVCLLASYYVCCFDVAEDNLALALKGQEHGALGQSFLFP